MADCQLSSPHAVTRDHCGKVTSDRNRVTSGVRYRERDLYQDVVFWDKRYFQPFYISFFFLHRLHHFDVCLFASACLSLRAGSLASIYSLGPQHRVARGYGRCSRLLSHSAPSDNRSRFWGLGVGARNRPNALHRPTVRPLHLFDLQAVPRLLKGKM